MNKQMGSMRSYAVILLCCIIGLIVMLLLMAKELNRTSDFNAVIGKITNITIKVEYGVENDSKSTLIKYVESAYEADGKTYQTKYRTFFTINKHVGDDVVIRYAPTDPTNTRNEFLIEVAVCALAFLGVFSLFLISVLIKQKKR